MLIAICIISLAFAWLLYETECLTLRLPVGAKQHLDNSVKLLTAGKVEQVLMLPLGITKPKYARYQVFQSLRVKRCLSPIHEGSNIPEDVEPNFSTIPCYQIYLDPGIEPMCGYDWLDRHCADMVDFKQHIEMNLGNVRYTMDIKAHGIIGEVMKANKLSKQEKAKIQKLNNPLLEYGNKVIRRKSKKLVKA